MRWTCILLGLFVGQIQGQMFASFGKRKAVVAWESVEARLYLDCRDFEKDEKAADIPRCIDSLKKNKKEFFSRTGGTSRFIGKVTWKQEDLQGLQQNQPIGEFVDSWNKVYVDPNIKYFMSSGVWVDGVMQTKSGCDPNTGFCRYMRVCKMREEIWGQHNFLPIMYFKADPNVHLYDNGDIEDRDALAPQITERCLACPVMACDSYTCPNGKVNAVPQPTVNGLVITKPACSKSCSAGTFLTCRTDAECKYQVMTDTDVKSGDAGVRKWYSENVYNLKTNVNVPLLSEAGPPVSECYPCYLARDRSHYGKVASTEDTFYDQNFLKFVCPGGDEEPKRCATNEVSRFNVERKTSTGCKCQPGFFREGDRCVPCTAGFYCAWNAADEPVKLPCPTDKYSLSGASVCVDCDTNTNCGAGLALTRCKQSQGAEVPGAFQTRNARCVSCEACQQLGGDTPCYRVSPMIAGI